MFIKAGDSGTKKAWGNEPKQGCFGSLRSQRKGGLGDRFQGFAWDELSLPIALLVASLLGSLRVEEKQACGGRRSWRRKARRCSWEGECSLEPLFEGFKTGRLGEDLGRILIG